MASALPPSARGQTAAAAHSSAAQAAAAQPLIDDFLAAVYGDDAARADFLRRRGAAEPRMPRAEFAPVLANIARSSGGLKLTSWQSRGRLRLTVTAANGRTARIDLAQ